VNVCQLFDWVDWIGWCRTLTATWQWLHSLCFLLAPTTSTWSHCEARRSPNSCERPSVQSRKTLVNDCSKSASGTTVQQHGSQDLRWKDRVTLKCLIIVRWWTGRPSTYITNLKLYSAFYPSGVGKSSTGLSGCMGLRRGAFICVS